MTLQTPSDAIPDLYESVEDIETPAVVVDLDVMEANVEKYAAAAREHDVALRSHVKTHKIPDLAHYQNEVTGGGGIVCQTLSEAEVMAQGGLDDIYLSYMVVGDRKLDRLVRLSEKLDRFATTVDGPGNTAPLQAAAARHDATVHVLLELDVGLERVGVAPGDDAIELGRYIRDQPNLELDGVMAYEGHVKQDAENETESEYEDRILAVMDAVADAVDEFEAAGISIDEVKVGSTATSLYSCKHPVVTEINPGMYPFNDVKTYRKTPHIDREDCALSVVSTVISAPTDDRVIVDAGHKTIAQEADVPPEERTFDGVRYYAASEEHGWLDVGDCDESFAVGDRLAFIPPHVCPTINLHDTLVGVRDGEVEEVWEVQARGKVK